MTMEALCEDSSGQLPPSSQRETRHPTPITVRGGALAPPSTSPAETQAPLHQSLGPLSCGGETRRPRLPAKKRSSTRRPEGGARPRRRLGRRARGGGQEAAAVAGTWPEGPGRPPAVSRETGAALCAAGRGLREDARPRARSRRPRPCAPVRLRRCPGRLRPESPARLADGSPPVSPADSSPPASPSARPRSAALPRPEHLHPEPRAPPGAAGAAAKGVPRPPRWKPGPRTPPAAPPLPRRHRAHIPGRATSISTCSSSPSPPSHPPLRPAPLGRRSPIPFPPRPSGVCGPSPIPPRPSPQLHPPLPLPGRIPASPPPPSAPLRIACRSPGGPPFSSARPIPLPRAVAALRAPSPATPPPCLPQPLRQAPSPPIAAPSSPRPPAAAPSSPPAPSPPRRAHCTSAPSSPRRAAAACPDPCRPLRLRGLPSSSLAAATGDWHRGARDPQDGDPAAGAAEPLFRRRGRSLACRPRKQPRVAEALAGLGRGPSHPGQRCPCDAPRFQVAVRGGGSAAAEGLLGDAVIWVKWWQGLRAGGRGVGRGGKHDGVRLGASMLLTGS